MILVFVACAPPSSLGGTLVDGRTGLPIEGTTVRAETPDAACLRVSSVTDASGRFAIDDPCPAPYTLVPVDPTWVLPSPVPGAAEAQLSAWKTPSSGGIWLLAAGELRPAPTNTAVGTSSPAPETTIRYPLVLPGEPPTLHDADLLVLAGAELADWGVVPVSPSPTSALGISTEPIVEAEWFVFGPRPAAATVAEVSPPSPPLPLRYLAAGALPPGSYALTAEASPRALLFSVAD